ncbi:hypothetical protein DID88_008792 [Monilinia fructigena]|nr:hypothetical protein DID88_008792 [Monilinia fructigena]
MGNDGVQDFNFESFSSEPWSSSEENATAHGNAVPPMSNEAFAEFLASISNPAVSEIDAMFGFGNRSSAPSNMYDNFTVFHTTLLEYGVPSETAQAARPASSSSRSTPPVVEGSPFSTSEVVEPLVGSSDRVELAPEVVRPSAIESVAEVSVPEAGTRVINSPEMAELKSFFQKQLEEQQAKFEAALRKQSEGQSAAMKKLEERSAGPEKLVRREKVRTKAAATADWEWKAHCYTKDNAKKRVGPSKKPVPAKSHTPVVKEAVPVAKKTFPGGQKLASAARRPLLVPAVRMQSASVPKKRAAASKLAPSGQKPSGLTKKGSSRDHNSDQKYLARAMLSKKGPKG